MFLFVGAKICVFFDNFCWIYHQKDCQWLLPLLSKFISAGQQYVVSMMFRLSSVFWSVCGCCCHSYFCFDHFITHTVTSFLFYLKVCVTWWGKSFEDSLVINYHQKPISIYLRGRGLQFQRLKNEIRNELRKWQYPVKFVLWNLKSVA